MNPQKLEMSSRVINAINEELAYQATLAETGRADRVDHGVAGQLVVLNTYIQKAMKDWTNSAGDEASLNGVRKIAAIAVRALELYGCPRRSAGGK